MTTPPTITPTKTFTAYAVYLNTDNTEGRGKSFPWQICEHEVTAQRLAKGRGVQGTDAYYYPVPIFVFNGKQYGPIELVPPSLEDHAKIKLHEAERVLEEKRQAVLDKIRDIGLTDEELNLLKYNPTKP